MSQAKTWLERLGLVFVGLVILLVFLSFYARRLFDPKLGINVLFMAEDGVGILSVHPESQTVGLVKLPSDLKIPLGLDGPEYSLEAIRKTGLPERDGMVRFRQGTGLALGVIVPALVRTKGKLTVPAFLEDLWSWRTQTNLTLVDRYRLIGELDRLIKRGLNLEVSFPKTVTDMVEEPDGRRFLKLNAAIYAWSRNQWVSETVLAETAEVGVVNASEVEGLARVVARQLETAGVRVVEVTKSELSYPGKCLVVGTSGAHPITRRLMSRYLGCAEEKMDRRYLPRVNEGADLWLILGEKY